MQRVMQALIGPGAAQVLEATKPFDEIETPHPHQHIAGHADETGGQGTKRQGL